MNKLIKLNEFRVDKTYPSTGKTYQVTKKQLTYICSVCSQEDTVNIKTSKEDKKGSVFYGKNY